jgi:hypothetical protein
MAWRLRLAQAAAEVSRVKGDGPGDPPRIHLPDDRGRGKRIPRAGWGN